MIIVGAGEVGFHIAQRLALEGKDVVVIDKSSEALRRITDLLDVQTFQGSGSSPKILEAAGIISLSLECVPDRVAKIITEELTIPVTGIGAGPYVDGQTLNLYDILGLFERFTPKMVKKYAQLSQDILQALQVYKDEIEQGIFPGPEHSFHIKDEVLKEVTEKRD